MSEPQPSAGAPLLRRFGREFASAGGLLSPDHLGSGLTLGEVRCLYEIGDAARLSVSDLAARCGLDLGYVSRAASRLTSRGLIEKRDVSADRRARSLVITAHGRKELHALEAVANKRLDVWLEGKPDQKVAALISGLRSFFGQDHRAILLSEPRPGDMGRIIERHAEIYVNEFGYGVAFENHVVRAFADFVEGFAPPLDRLVVARRGDELIGSVAVKRETDAPARLRFLLVEPAARSSGLGRQLVREAVEHARTCGASSMVLETGSDLTAARHIYAAAGFVRTSVRTAAWLPSRVLSETWTLDFQRSAAT